jgi:hypothetical protein
MDIINGLWVGRIGPTQRLSINSFLSNGHPYRLWAYEPQEVPNGTILADANEIVPKSVLDRWPDRPHRLQTFANYFRYELIHKYGGWWMDLDCICVRPLVFDAPYVFCSIDGVRQRPQLADLPCHIINGAFKAPKGAAFLQDIIKKIKDQALTGDYPDFGIWGTVVFTRTIFDYGLDFFKAPANIFIPFGFQDVVRIYTDPTLKIPEWAYTVHLYNYTGPDYDKFTDGTVYTELVRRYGEVDLSRAVPHGLPLFG